MPVPVTALYAVLLAAISIVLGFFVGRERLRKQVSLLDGGDPVLIEAIRRHANFTESVPLALILMLVVELNGASAAWMHGLGATLVAARLVHPLGIDFRDMRRPARGIGSVATTLVLATTMGLAIAQLAG